LLVTLLPEGNGKDFLKWSLRIGGSAALGKKIYEGIHPKDNTNTIAPRPPLDHYLPPQ